MLLDDVVWVLSERQPLLLVVDDLQWADDASLDALALLAAGLERQRLGLVLAFRDEDRRESGALDGWLRDTRRMPLVDELSLERLDREATGQLVAALTNEPEDPDLADEVYARTRGTRTSRSCSRGTWTRTDVCRTGCRRTSPRTCWCGGAR